MPVQSPTEKRTILRQLIDERGLKYGFVAEKVGITPSTLTRLMNGDRPLTASEMLALESVLGVEHDAFFDGRGLRLCSGQASPLDAVRLAETDDGVTGNYDDTRAATEAQA